MLDNITVFRFGQIYKSGGGIEEHINSIDSILLSKYNMTIIRSFIGNTAGNFDRAEEKLGKGKLVWLPLEPIKEKKPIYLDPLINLRWPTYKTFSAKGLLKCVNKLLSMYLNSYSYLRLNYNNLERLIRQSYMAYPFDLAVIHTIFGMDEALIINELVKLRVPILVIHHFDSNRLNHPLIRCLLDRVTAIGTVNSINIPDRLRKKTFRIVEGVDENFWDTKYTYPRDRNFDHKLILLAARIHPSKGHLDALKALLILRREGISANLVFAGRVDSNFYLHKINYFVKGAGLTTNVLNLGNLNNESLREWYAASSVVILPSYSEGLGRSLLEAQLMRCPVIAYDTGGTKEAIRDQVTGFLVKVGNVQELANRLIQLLKDESLRKSMGDKGREYVLSNFSLEKMARSHEELYIWTINNYK